MDRRLFYLHNGSQLFNWERDADRHPFRYVCPSRFQDVHNLTLFQPHVSPWTHPAHNRVYLANKDICIFGYALSFTLIEYQTDVLHGFLDAAAEISLSIPKEQRNKVARFLEARGQSLLLYIDCLI